MSPLLTCQKCWHVHAEGDACVVPECDRMGDYDNHTIGADPFLEPSVKVGLWTKIKRSLGW